MAHWADHCTICHANNGSGDTMYGKTMYPRPPDMRQKDTQEISDGELYYTIKNDVRLSGMPAFGDPGDDDLDSWKLVAFIRHLPTLSDQDIVRFRFHRVALGTLWSFCGFSLSPSDRSSTLDNSGLSSSTGDDSYLYFRPL